MERVNFGYSMKNIPIPSTKEYKKSLIEKTESVLKRMRWKAFHFLNRTVNKQENKETYGFKTSKYPPQPDEMKPFEDDVLKMVEMVEFRNTKCAKQNSS